MEIIRFIGALFGWLMLLGLIIMVIMFVCVLCGVHLKRKKTGSNKQARPEVPTAPTPELTRPVSVQERLEEIDRNIDDTVGAIQANPMSPGSAACDAQIAALEQEKQTRLRRIARYMDNVTVQDARKTFTPEQQKRFDAQVYQHSQDVGRGGLEREAAAANRGLVFVDARPVPKEVAARFEELKKAAAAEKERRKNMTTLQPMDYPVPFTELLIYPNRITNRPKTAQILHAEEGASYGGRFKETVSLHEENGRTVLVCEKQRRDEHSPQEDSEWSMRAKLSQVPQSVHYIPLTKWALSLPWWANLRAYTDLIEVNTAPDGPVAQQFGRYRRIKHSTAKNSRDQLGWICTDDKIGIGFDPDVYLCRESHWREAPSGLSYHVTVKMRLLPDVCSQSHEKLLELMDRVPWWNPDEADRLMWDARNWLDAYWLQKQADLWDSMHRKNPRSDRYEKALDEVLKQLCLLEEQKPGEEA